MINKYLLEEIQNNKKLAIQLEHLVKSKPHKKKLEEAKLRLEKSNREIALGILKMFPEIKSFSIKHNPSQFFSEELLIESINYCLINLTFYDYHHQLNRFQNNDECKSFLIEEQISYQQLENFTRVVFSLERDVFLRLQGYWPE